MDGSGWLLIINDADNDMFHSFCGLMFLYVFFYKIY